MARDSRQLLQAVQPLISADCIFHPEPPIHAQYRTHPPQHHKAPQHQPPQYLTHTSQHQHTHTPQHQPPQYSTHTPQHQPPQYLTHTPQHHLCRHVMKSDGTTTSSNSRYHHTTTPLLSSSSSSTTTTTIKLNLTLTVTLYIQFSAASVGWPAAVAPA